MLAQTTLGQIAGECVWESSAGQREGTGALPSRARHVRACKAFENVN